MNPQAPEPSWWQRNSKALSYVAALVAIGAILWLMIHMTTQNDATQDEDSLWQAILFIIGVGITFYLGQQSVKEAAKDILKPHGKAAVRRLVTLISGIQQYSVVIDEEREHVQRVAAENNGSIDLMYVEHALDVIQGHIRGELGTAGDALEDWRDVVPEEVEAVVESASQGDAE